MVIDNIKQVTEIAGAIVKATAGTEGGKQAAEELGKTALTVTKLVNNALLPIAAVNFAFDKARQYFTEKFAEDMQERVKNIPADQLTAPKASIAGQALQGLAYSHDEVELKNLYLALLAKAMDKRTVSTTHPAFVDIIRQLSAAEIDVLTKVLTFHQDIAIVELHLNVPEGGYHTLRRHILDLRNVATDAPVETPNMDVYVENWRRLGLVDVAYDKHLIGENIYTRFESRPEFLAAKNHETETKKLEIQKGILHRTKFGKDFAAAVGMMDRGQKAKG